VGRFFLILVAVWVALTAFGLRYVRPVSGRDAALVRSIWAMADLETVAGWEADYRSWHRERFDSDPPPFETLATLGEDSDIRAEQVARFRDWYGTVRSGGLDGVPRLVWATDDNPARQRQMQQFRRWHLARYDEPIDIVSDPSGRDTGEGASVTKPIVQSLGGAGADIIGTYGPKNLEALVRSGIVLDVTEIAAERGFPADRCFQAARSSFCLDGRQYGFPANVGYTVLLYHVDMFEEAGIEPPRGGWTTDELIEVANRLTVESDEVPGGKRFGIVGMHPWPMSLAAGGRFFVEDGTRSRYNAPETVDAFRVFRDLMYEHEVMPTPAETASMAAAGGFTGGGNNELFFAARLCAMTIGGRWACVTFARTNWERVIRPRLRSLAEDDPALGPRVDRIAAVLDRDVLEPIDPVDVAWLDAVLTPADRERLLRIGVAHVPTLDGSIRYPDVGARVALVNRASPHREHAIRFLEFLASEPYNERINQAFDSICGVIEYCVDDDGISGPPEPLPGLEAFDSPVFVEAMSGAESQQLSPFIGPERLGYLVGEVMDQLTNDRLTPAEAARLAEDRINRQIRANVERVPELAERWEALTGEPVHPRHDDDASTTRDADHAGEDDDA